MIETSETVSDNLAPSGGIYNVHTLWSKMMAKTVKMKKSSDTPRPMRSRGKVGRLVSANTNREVRGILSRLSKARSEAGLNQNDAASLLGFSTNSEFGSGGNVSNYENGRSQITLALLLDMCRIYNVSVSWVLTGIDDGRRLEAAVQAGEDLGTAFRRYQASIMRIVEEVE